jgi:DNA processing protein
VGRGRRAVVRGEGGMDGRELRLALWLHRGVSSRMIRRVLAEGPVSGEPGDREALVDALGVRGAAREALLAAPELSGVAAEEIRRLVARGGRVVLRGDPEYPGLLEDLPDPPEAVEVRGVLPPARSVAVVGSRQAPASARALARKLGAALARAGFGVVSGGALGIDGAAHGGALEAGGVTVAVLGSGVLRPGPPRHRRLFAAMVEGGGGLVSELPCEADGRREHFPRRNRLIAALAEAVVVVAAGEGSGALYTAEAARGMGRALFAAHGGDEAAGCAGLIAGGARELRSPGDLLRALGVEVAEDEVALATPEEAAIWRVLGPTPGSLAALAAGAGIEAAAAARALTALCARGLARPAGPGRFARR